MKIAYLDCFSGASGDMLLGCLVDAGLPLEDLQEGVSRLGLSGYMIGAQRVTRQGLSGTCLRVAVEDEQRPARTLPAIEEILSRSRLSEPARVRSLSIFRRLARVEAQVHGTTVEAVHFHELSAVDTLVDVVGFVCALEQLGIDAVYSSPLAVGSGWVETEHGRLPVPAPATLALLAESGAPIQPSPAQVELLTPTGAVLLTELATFGQPAMRIEAIGYGFGRRELPWPNAVRVWLGEAEPKPAGAEEDVVVEICCNLDNATGETLGFVMERLLQSGALDVWFTPIQMKKNRPAVQLSLLARPEDAERLSGVVLRETPTLGVRRRSLCRTKAAREMRQVETEWGAVRVKVKSLGGSTLSAAPEYEDCAAIAGRTGLPLETVFTAARVLALDRE